MKRVTTIALLFLFSICSAQTNTKLLLDAVIIKAKETSMYASTVNWDSLQKQMYAKAENAKTIQELKPAFECLLNGLKDYHGKIINAKDYSAIAYFTDYENLNHPDKRIRDSKTWKVVNDTALQFDYKMLKDKTAYLKIVGIGPNVDIQLESRRIRNAVIELSKNKADKWIIDLRYNGGGNMYPMVSGIGTLIGDGIVGKLVNAKKDTLFSWRIKNGNFTYDVPDVVILPNTPKFKKTPKIAVLTSRWTTSSGEVVATCLKGRPNTKFFGEATGSYTTNTNWEVINDQLILTISTGIYCDRNDVVYEKNIPVDVEIPFEVITEVEKDNCVVEAKKWLNKK
jgi:carboxyl-terminal processing protease